MYTLKETKEFTAWFADIKDSLTRIRLGRRLERVEKGTLGDVEPVGDGVSEMREHFGPGWRIYFVQRGPVVIVLLGGGEKSTQRKDIAAAKKLAATLED